MNKNIVITILTVIQCQYNPKEIQQLILIRLMTGHYMAKLKNHPIHGFKDSVPVRKMHGCYYDTQKFRATSHSYPSDIR